MAWAQPINTMTLDELNEIECQICFNPLFVVSPEIPNPQPCEITTCHHRFHGNCLRNTWCNNNAGNTLDACRCPTCNQVFSCNTQLEDLTEQVAERMRILQEPPAVAPPVAAQEQPVVARGQQIDNLQNYTLANYRIDQIKKRFIECITEIVNDAWELVIYDRRPDITTYYYTVRGFRDFYGREEDTRELAKSMYISGQIVYIDEIINNTKNNIPFSENLRNILETLNIINGRLQNGDFLETLNDWRQGAYLNAYGRGSDDMAYLGKVEYLLNLLGECYVGRIIPPPAPPNQTSENPFPNNIKDFVLKNMVFEFLRFKKNFYSLDRSIHNHAEETAYINALLPVASGGDIPPYIRPDLQFFRRYFQCFVDFITQLLDVNYNAAFQVGGKRQKKYLTKRKRTNKKRRTNRHKK